MRQPQQTTDWGAMIEQLQSVNVTLGDMGRAMQSIMTHRMVRHYSNGVQPVHFRGEALIAMWCEKLGRDRSELPTTELVRGHRVTRNTEPVAGPKIQNLPNWPPAAPVAVKPIKRGRARA